MIIKCKILEFKYSYNLFLFTGPDYLYPNIKSIQLLSDLLTYSLSKNYLILKTNSSGVLVLTHDGSKTSLTFSPLYLVPRLS